MQQTCMGWGFEVGDGWFNIINGLSLMIQGHIDGRTRERWRVRKHKRQYAKMDMADQIKHNWMNDDMPFRIPQVVAGQVKEKFGALRFYYSGGDEAIENYVSMAEAMSYITCDTCGSPGKLGGKGWISVKCKKHGGGDFFAVKKAKKKITKADIEGEQ
jgi:hypothetical protein